MPEIDIKWVKITTDMFDNEKIKLIRKMPEGDAILVLWVQLICLAGKCNAGGDIKLSETIPYTDEMLAIALGRELPVVRLALGTLQQFKMIEWQNGKELFIINFSKHQNIEGMDRVRKLNADRNREYRLRQKQLLLPEPKNTSDVSVTSRDAVDKNRLEKNIREGDENFPKKLWGNVLESLKAMTNQVNFETWFSGTEGIAVEDNVLYVGVKSESGCDHLKNHAKQMIMRCICEVPGNGHISDVDFIVLDKQIVD